MQHTQGNGTNKKILVIPAAGRCTRYQTKKPKWLLTHPHGTLMIEEVIAGLNLSDYDEKHIVILKEHCDQFAADIMIKQIFGDAFHITILDAPTSSAPETVVECIKRNNLDGTIIIKDCDCLVRFKMPDVDNFVVGLDIHTQSVKNITAKSFITYNNKNNIINNIVEKKVISDTICLGIYCLNSRSLLYAYDALSTIADRELYFSHLISFLISNGEIFFVAFADKFIDWGTSTEWEEYTSNLKTYIFDIDGVFLENRGRYGKETWENTFIPIEDNIKVLKNLSDKGEEIIFITSRDDRFLVQFKTHLKQENINYKTIVSGCNHNKRIIVNDFFATNPYPSCEAINVPRNGKLKEYIS